MGVASSSVCPFLAPSEPTSFLPPCLPSTAIGAVLPINPPLFSTQPLPTFHHSSDPFNSQPLPLLLHCFSAYTMPAFPCHRGMTPVPTHLFSNQAPADATILRYHFQYSDPVPAASLPPFQQLLLVNLPLPTPLHSTLSASIPCQRSLSTPFHYPLPICLPRLLLVPPSFFSSLLSPSPLSPHQCYLPSIISRHY